MKQMQEIFALLKRLEIDVHRGSRGDDRPEWLKDMPSARDNTAFYYPFLYHLAASPEYKNILEIGTYKASSAAHLAVGAKKHGGHVLTLDVDPEAARLADEVAKAHELPITALVVDSRSPATLRAVEELRLAPFDILFIDSAHNFSQAYDEYQRYRHFVREHGLIFFDDVGLDAEMRTLWDYIADPKIRLDLLHYTGFGAALKSRLVVQPLTMLDADAVRAAIARHTELA